MYKTAVITDEISQDLNTAAQMAARFGLDALEIRSVWGRDPFAHTPQDVQAIRRAAREHSLEICAIAAPIFKCDLNSEEEYQAHLAGAERCMQTACELGARLVRSFTFWSHGCGNGEFDRIIDRYQPVLRLAERYGITLVIESEPSVTTGSIVLLEEFLKRVGHPRVAALYDPGNEMWTDNPEKPYPAGYERLCGRIAHVHVKDMRHGLVPARLGEGDVDFRGLFRRLKADGYAGYVSVETHYRDVQLNDDLLVHPAGAAFSAGGERATEDYLTTLRDTYRWMEAQA